METKKKRISLPVIVEGKYDKNTLSQIFDCTVITTDGFSVFNSKEKQALLKKLSRDGLIVLTDSDGGGKQIRGFLRSLVPQDKLYNLYIPRIKGKERRKKAPSKEGMLGVEGMEREVLEKIFAPFTADSESMPNNKKMLTKVDFYNNKLTGFPNSKERRRALCDLAELPDNMTPNALLEALNLLFSAEEFEELVEKLQSTEAR